MRPQRAEPSYRRSETVWRSKNVEGAFRMFLQNGVRAGERTEPRERLRLIVSPPRPAVLNYRRDTNGRDSSSHLGGQFIGKCQRRLRPLNQSRETGSTSTAIRSLVAKSPSSRRAARTFWSRSARGLVRTIWLRK